MRKFVALLCLLTMLLTISVNAEEKERKTVKDYRYYMEFSFTADTDMCTINGVNRRIDETEEIIPYISEQTGDFMLPLRATANFYEIYVHWDSRQPNLILLTSSPSEENAKKIGNVEYYADPELVIELHSGYIDSHGKVVSSIHSEDGMCLYKVGLARTGIRLTHMYSENVNGRTFVPAQSIANMFGFTTEWIEEEKKMILTEIPDEELYVQEIKCDVDGNIVKITSYTTNNTLTPVGIAYSASGSAEWPVTGNIYDTNGKLVWSSPGVGSPGVPWSDVLLPGEVRMSSQKFETDLKPGTYYYEAQETKGYVFQFFRHKSVPQTIRVYFEIE